MQIQNLYPGSWGSNCYVLTAGTHAAVVDPSVDAKTVVNAIKAAGASLDMILLTHGHFDHICAIDDLRAMTNAPLYVHQADAPMLTDAHKNAFYTFFHMERSYRPAEQCLRDGDVLQLGEETIRLLHTPGHSPGSSCFLCNDSFLLTGDTLFANGYGRYDLWGGNREALADTLQKMRELPQNLPIYPGHGEASVLGNALDEILFF